jgi:alkylation response protein AidB-like acyl-CoA dehydrogenase
MKIDNYFSANRDLSFYYEKVIDWNRLVPLFAAPPEADAPAETAATWRAILDMAGEYVGREVAVRAAEVDRLGVPHAGDITVSPPMTEDLAGLARLGLIGLGLPREYGGEGLPFVIHAGVFEPLARADSAAMVQYAFYTSPAAMIVRFGADAQRERWVPRLARGEVIGWVAMTEPEAGSDVGNISTRAERQPDGSWRINGRKQFISSGNGQVGIVLARAIAGSKGLDGLALFVVPRCVPDDLGGERENYAIERAEDKLCITGSPTCALAFSDTQAEIMGVPGDGWRQITSFMNEARLAVGIQACGVAQAALVAAQEYAAQRVQMGKPVREHPLVAQMLLDMETTVAGLRALWMEAAVAYDLVQGLQRQLAGLSDAQPERSRVEARLARVSRYLRDLTPLVKYYGAEEAIRVARLAMQVHGGYGVVRDYEVERFLRDSLILPIYEGTSQIQALMAVKDLLKGVLRRPHTLAMSGGFNAALAGARFEGQIGRSYRHALRDTSGAVNWLLWDLVRGLGPKRSAAVLRGAGELEEDELGYVLLSAEHLTQMLAHLHIARLLGQQAERWPERQPLAERFARRAEELCRANAAHICGRDRDALVAARAWQTERLSA